MTAAPRKGLSAIVVTWNTGPRLDDCVASLRAEPLVDEIIVVDNGNPPEVSAALAAAARAETRLRHLEGHGNVGFAAACNLGAGLARGRDLLFLNPDAALSPGAAGRLLAEATRRRATGRPFLLGGRVLGLDGREQRGARRGELTLWSAAKEALGLTRLARLHPIFETIHWERRPVPDAPVEVKAVSGAFMLIPADAFATIGGFDEGYFAHVEDIDICRRVREEGGVVVFVPAAEAVHEGATSPASPARIALLKARGLRRYFKKFGRNLMVRGLSAALFWVMAAAAFARGLRTR